MRDLINAFNLCTIIGVNVEIYTSKMDKYALKTG